jgi:transcriptional regulator
VRRVPWKISDAPSEFIDNQLKAIVGLEIEISEIKGKWKMSQNKTPDDIRGVIDGLADPRDPQSNTEVANRVFSLTSSQ